ncbi:MAG: hypothetical protein AB1432_12985 [Bacteroidota bacterium]
MNLGYKKIFGVVLVLSGLSLLASQFKLIRMDFFQIFGTVLVMLGIFSVSISLKRNRRDLLFVFAAVFLVGIVFITKFYFDIRDTREIVFTSIHFITGGALLMLYIENQKEKIFLINGIVFLLIGYLSITLLRDAGITRYADVLGRLAKDFWPVVLILSGVTLFLNRKK